MGFNSPSTVKGIWKYNHKTLTKINNTKIYTVKKGKTQQQHKKKVYFTSEKIHKYKHVENATINFYYLFYIIPLFSILKFSVALTKPFYISSFFSIHFVFILFCWKTINNLFFLIQLNENVLVCVCEYFNNISNHCNCRYTKGKHMECNLKLKLKTTTQKLWRIFRVFSFNGFSLIID